MVDVGKLRTGNTVRISNTISGWHFYRFVPPVDLNPGHIFTFLFDVSKDGESFACVETADARGDYLLALANPDDLEISGLDPITAVHDMRSAGPPKPLTCSCDTMALMRVGCRCGHFQKEMVHVYGY